MYFIFKFMMSFSTFTLVPNLNICYFKVYLYFVFHFVYSTLLFFLSICSLLLLLSNFHLNLKEKWADGDILLVASSAYENLYCHLWSQYDKLLVSMLKKVNSFQKHCPTEKWTAFSIKYKISFMKYFILMCVFSKFRLSLHFLLLYTLRYDLQIQNLM